MAKYIYRSIFILALVLSQVGGAVAPTSAHEDSRPANFWQPQALEPDYLHAESLLQNVVALESGWHHTCALTSSGGVKCWGKNSLGQLGDGTTTDRNYPVDVVGLSSGVVAIAAGAEHTCAVMENGGVKCWGWLVMVPSIPLQPIDIPNLSSGAESLAAGVNFSCALMVSGGVKCFGDNTRGQLGDGGGEARLNAEDVSGLTSGVSAVAAQGIHVCALLVSGGVKCWGDSTRGQVGDGWSDYYRLYPTDVVGLASGVTALTSGGAHTCALLTNGGVKCWGNNGLGDLGDGTFIDRLTPVGVVGLTDSVTYLAAGWNYTCALTTSGIAKCWGDNQAGQFGNGTTNVQNTPLSMTSWPSGIVALAPGRDHTCALMIGGSVKCWGDNQYGQVGDGSVLHRDIPRDVSELATDITAQTTGWIHTCAVTTSGGVKCWGDNTDGQLGDGTIADHATPMPVNGMTSNGPIVAGGAHTCAVTSSGSVECWGDNTYGQLGDGTTTDRWTPVQVSGLGSGVIALAAGGNHTCALTSSGGVECWGYNASGQLGDGTRTDHWTPTDVIGLSNAVTALTARENHTCAVTSSGEAKCWGSNYRGQLGDGTTTDRLTPVQVSGLSNGVTAISAGGTHSCAVTSSGGVKCWGYNSNGQLGDGTTTERLTPVDVSGLSSGVTTLTARGNRTCAITSSDGAKCWGENYYGQLGDGTTADRWTPIDVIGLSSGVTALTAGGNHTCAIVTSDRMKCWGWDRYGQLGLDTYFQTQWLTPSDVVASSLSLVFNYSHGQPGSFFTLTGEKFTASSLLTVTVNGSVLTTTLSTSETGSFIVFLDTASADVGYYTVTISTNPSVRAVFLLSTQSPLCVEEGGGTVLVIPAGIAQEPKMGYLPFIVGQQTSR